jgi:hypothetical protein
MRYPCHGAEDHTDLVGEKGFSGSEEANGGHGGWLSSRSLFVSILWRHCLHSNKNRVAPVFIFIF